MSIKKIIYSIICLGIAIFTSITYIENAENVKVLYCILYVILYIFTEYVFFFPEEAIMRFQLIRRVDRIEDYSDDYIMIVHGVVYVLLIGVSLLPLAYAQ